MARTRKARSPLVDSHIKVVRDPGVCAGHPVLAGSRTTIHDIVGYVKLYDGDVEVAHAEALSHLPIEDLHAVMAWYDENRGEIDEILRLRREDYERGLAEATASR